MIVTALEPAYLEPMLLRGTQRRIVPYSRAVEYASRRPALEWLRGSRLSHAEVDASSRLNAHDTRALDRSPVCAITADEAPNQLANWIRSGIPVVLDTSFIPKEFVVERLLGTELELSPSDRTSWLSRFGLRH